MFLEKKPDEIDLLAFFESEPVSFDKDNLSFLYAAQDKKGISVNFSFSIVEGWLKVSLEFSGEEIVCYSIDGVSEFSIRKDSDGEYLYSEVKSDSGQTKLYLTLRPNIKIECHSLS